MRRKRSEERLMGPRAGYGSALMRAVLEAGMEERKETRPRAAVHPKTSA